MSARRVAVITGSATGVGAAAALALAGRGYDVLINYSKSEAEAKASSAACQAAGADTLLVRGDVAEDADCKAVVQAAVERWGRIDALVNSAGVTTPSRQRRGSRSSRRGSPKRSASKRCARSRWNAEMQPQAAGCRTEPPGGFDGHRLQA